MDTLLLQPDQSGYQLQASSPIVAVTLDGGAPRMRLDQLGSVGTCDVQWTLGASDYNYLMAFYRTTIALGSLPFNVSLILDNATPTAYQVWIVPQSFKLASQKGLTYVVSCSLYVTPLATNAANDEAIVALYETAGSGSAATALISQLSTFVNVQLPGI